MKSEIVIKKDDKTPALTLVQGSNADEAREIWSQVVASFKTISRQWLASADYKAAIMGRIGSFYKSNDIERVYNDCLTFIQTHSSLVVSFNAEFLKKGLDHPQLLNVFEKNHQDSVYMARREKTEQGLFQALDEKLKNKFFSNPHARPHYAALVLHDNDHIAPVKVYGKSYVVLRDIVKFNSLFVPVDSMLHNEIHNANELPCGLYQMEILLWQAPDLFLKALVHRVTQGSFPDYYTQQDGCIQCCSYIEALIPAVKLHPLFIELIHIDENEYKLIAEEKAVLDEIGLNVTNCLLNPYPEFKRQMLKSVENKDYKQAKALLHHHPSLINVTNNQAYPLLHFAIHSGFTPLVQLFLAWGVNPNTLTQDHHSALTLAMEFGSRAMVQMIMPGLNVATINHKNAKGESALFVAAKKGYLITVTLLLTIPGVDAQAKCDEKTALQVAKEKSYFRVARCIRIFMNKKAADNMDVKLVPNSLKVVVDVDTPGKCCLSG